MRWVCLCAQCACTFFYPRELCSANLWWLFIRVRNSDRMLTPTVLRTRFKPENRRGRNEDNEEFGLVWFGFIEVVRFQMVELIRPTPTNPNFSNVWVRPAGVGAEKSTPLRTLLFPKSLTCILMIIRLKVGISSLYHQYLARRNKPKNKTKKKTEYNYQIWMINMLIFDHIINVEHSN